ncbi:NB-ARC domain-containing protein [Cellulomonas phragmiteti]|uniref:AAA+ ATPase domain-containing protein n=1 Tax=Cellulomonas phragmiteti TaxID=478780 RepID=A0ABQ4DNZ1_9CELL|nr:NB-ARC domain-containing protein [Cellulomonas phragmiteti]GIG41071.1 hypothetical protein Cph01nite_28330 [Cellulomonas phragmiteti]
MARPDELDVVAEQLGALRRQVGSPSFAEIAQRIGARRAARGEPGDVPARSTVYDCFRPGRRRVDVTLVGDIVAALGLTAEESAAWLAGVGLHGAQGRWTEAAHGSGLRTEAPGLLVGRQRELEVVRRAVRERDVPVVLVEGMAGVGKSTLARHVGQDLVAAGAAERVLHLDVDGSSASRRPAGPMAVVAAAARHLDVRLPPTADVATARAALAAHLAGGRVLLILDDVPAADHVVALAGTDGLRLVVTSRRRLTLPAGVPHERVRLRPLGRRAAHELLRQVAGQARVDADPTGAARIVEELGGLPLALDLTARRVAATPTWSLADHAEHVAARRRTARVEEGVRAAFHLSYVDLEPRPARTLRLLAAQPCAALTVPEVAALTGSTDGVAERDVAALEAVHLVQRDTAGGIRLHDLVRAFAAGVGQDEDPPSARTEAVARLRELWVQRAWAVHHVLGQDKAVHTSRTRQGWPTPGPAEARAWLDRLTVDAVLLVDPGTHPDPEQVVELSEALTWAFNYFSRWRPAHVLHTRARAVARATGDEAGVLRATLALGRMAAWRGEWDDATALLTSARRGFEALGERAHVEECVQALGVVAAQTGRLDEAAQLFADLVDDFLATGRVHRASMTRDNLGIVLRRAGRLTEAADAHRLAAAESASVGHGDDQSRALVNLSDVLIELGRPDEALVAARDGHRLAVAQDDERTMAYAVTNVGLALGATGDQARAVEHHREALALARSVGDPHLEASVLNNLADAHRDLGAHDLAVAGYRAADVLATSLQDPHEGGRARAGLAALAGPADVLAADPAGALSP